MVGDDRDRGDDGEFGEELDVFTGDPVDALFDVETSGEVDDESDLPDADRPEVSDAGYGDPGEFSVDARRGEELPPELMVPVASPLGPNGDANGGPNGDATGDDDLIEEFPDEEITLDRLQSFSDVPVDEDPYAALSQLGTTDDDLDDDFDDEPGPVPADPTPPASAAPPASPTSDDDRYAWLYDEKVAPPPALVDRYAPLQSDPGDDAPPASPPAATPFPTPEPAPEPVASDDEAVSDWSEDVSPTDETRIFESGATFPGAHHAADEPVDDPIDEPVGDVLPAAGLADEAFEDLLPADDPADDAADETVGVFDDGVGSDLDQVGFDDVALGDAALDDDDLDDDWGPPVGVADMATQRGADDAVDPDDVGPPDTGVRYPGVHEASARDGELEEPDVSSIHEDAEPIPPATDWEDFTGEHYITSSTQEYLGLAEELSRMDELTATEEPGEQIPVAAGIPGIETSLVGLDDVVGDEKVDSIYPTDTRPDLGMRLLTGFGLLALFVISLMWSTAVAVLATVLLVLAAGEFYAVLISNKRRPVAAFGLAGVAGCLVGTWVWGLVAVPVALVVTLVAVALAFALGAPRPSPLPDLALTVMVVAWIGGLGAFAFPIIEATEYRMLIGGVVLIVATLDIGQYFAGRRFGKRPLAPVVSPKKTVEGLIGGAVAAVVVAVVLSFVDPFSLTSALALAASAIVLGPLGDLSVSLVKRILGVKDMGTVLPGHGGILDRIDALLFVIPAAWVVYSATGLLI